MQFGWVETKGPAKTRARQRRTVNVVLFCVLGLAYAQALGGCATPPRSSRLTVEDFQEVAAAMAQSLRQSEAINDRTLTSDPWMISIDKIQNLTNDIIPISEQWAVMGMLRSSFQMTELWDLHRVAFVIPPEKAQRLRNELQNDPIQLSNDRQVTHTLIATFRSITRATEDHRSDYYYLEFELLPIEGGQPVWIDRFEIKRQAFGSLLD